MFTFSWLQATKTTLGPDVITPAHGEWIRGDFCHRCRETDFEYPILPKRVGGNLISEWTLGNESTCPLCRFIEAIARQSSVFATTVRLTTIINLPSPSIYRALSVQVFDEVHIRDERYFLRVTPNPGAYRCPQRSSVNVDFMRKCIAGCKKHHIRQCAAPDARSLSRISMSSGFHLIDCKHRIVGKAQRLHKYVALSYVWGRLKQQYDSEVEMQYRSVRILPRKLPRTIEDAIKVTLQLGFRYLWVDKYCISQSAQHGDFQKQIAAMDSVYYCAAVTIIAASGEDADGGLPGVGSKPRSVPPSIKINGATWVSGVRNPQTAVAKSVWATRGWVSHDPHYLALYIDIGCPQTYQENYFARRRLIFTDEQVLFECNSCQRNETIPLPILADVDLPGDIFGCSISLHRGALRGTLSLYEHTRLFTKRNLTYQNDVLNALQGIFASFLRRQQPSKQIWGIPIDAAQYGVLNQLRTSKRPMDIGIRSALAFGLTWQNASSHSAKRRIGFPSWSWAGWITPIHWEERYHPWVHHDVYFWILRRDGTCASFSKEVIDSMLLESNNNDETSIYTYHLVIEAEVTQVKFLDLWAYDSSEKRWSESPWDFRYAVLAPRGSEEEEYCWLLHLTPTIGEGDELHEALCRDIFECVLVTCQYGIVVREVNGVNERIGLLKLRAIRRSAVGNIRRDTPYPFTDYNLQESFPGTVKRFVLG